MRDYAINNNYMNNHTNNHKDNHINIHTDNHCNSYKDNHSINTSIINVNKQINYQLKFDNIN